MQDLGQHCRRGRLACFLAQWVFEDSRRRVSDMKRACILTECARGQAAGNCLFRQDDGSPGRCHFLGATLWSDLSMRCPESDRARTGGKAWRWAHNVTSSEVIAFYTPSSFSLLYAGSLRAVLVELIHSLPFLSILVADRLPRLALDGYDRGQALQSIRKRSRVARACCAPCWVPRQHLPRRLQHSDVEVDITLQAHRSDAHACHRDKPEQGMVDRLAHPVGWHSQRCRVGLAALPPGSMPTGRWKLKSIWAEAGCTGG